MVHKHVTALLNPIAVSQRSDETKSRLVVEPLHAAGKPGHIVVVGYTHCCFSSDNTSGHVFKFVFDYIHQSNKDLSLIDFAPATSSHSATSLGGTRTHFPCHSLHYCSILLFFF
jgi:hypothetical protein